MRSVRELNRFAKRVDLSRPWSDVDHLVAEEGLSPSETNALISLVSARVTERIPDQEGDRTAAVDTGHDDPFAVLGEFRTLVKQIVISGELDEYDGVALDRFLDRVRDVLKKRETAPITPF